MKGSAIKQFTLYISLLLLIAENKPIQLKKVIDLMRGEKMSGHLIEAVIKMKKKFIVIQRLFKFSNLITFNICID
jgi:hypothetical protein